VIGAGIMGCRFAYHSAARSAPTSRSSTKSYLCAARAGATAAAFARNGRARANVRLMQESIRMCQDFASEFKINVWLRQGGYLFLAR